MATSNKNLNKVNEKVATQKVIYNRVLKYKYPRGCTGPLERKAYRRQVRDKITKFQAEISQLRGQARTKAKEILRKYEAKHLSNV